MQLFRRIEVDSNRAERCVMDFGDMALFVAAVQGGSLSAGGRALGLSAAVASKKLARLEEHLNVRLLQRTSRRIALTGEGAIFFERCKAILADMRDAEDQVARGRKEVAGVLRVSATTSVGRQWVGPVAAAFARQHPAVTVHLILTDEVTDLHAAGVDVAVRVGANHDSRLVARTLADNRRVVCATPEYLRQFGEPRHPDELREHACILLSNSAAGEQATWTFQKTGEAPYRVPVSGRLISGSGQQVRDWVLEGHGLAWRSFWDVRDELASGRLVEVLAQWSHAAAPICALYPSRRHVPARTRLFIDSLVRRFHAHR